MKVTKPFRNGRCKLGAFVGLASVVLTGVLTCAAGTRTISSTGEFGDSFTAGWETISYTGPTATYGGLFTADPGSQHGTTVEVTDPSATLTLASSAQSSGGLVKTGPGGLTIKTGGITYGYSDVQGGYWSSYSHIRWTDGAVSYCYPAIAVVNGTLTIDAPGGSAESVMPDSVIGLYDTSSPAPSATMKVMGGTVNFNNSLTINRGVGTTSDHPASTLYVTTNAWAQMVNVWMTTSGIDNNSYSGDSFLDVDGGRVTVNNSVQFGRANGNAHILVRNGGLFEQKKTLESAWYVDNKPTWVFDLPNNSNAYVNTTFEISGCSTARIETVSNKKMKYSKYRNVVKVHDGGVLLLNNTSYYATNGLHGGFAEFNEATLAPLDFKLVSNWFAGLQSYDVGAGGLVVTNETLAYLGGTSTGSGTITKLGDGMLSLHPGSAAMDVRGGSIRLLANSYHPETAFDTGGTVTAANGTTVEIVGDGALGNMTLTPGGQRSVFRARGLEASLNGWEFSRTTSFRYDGWLKANETRRTEVGSIWRKEAMDVTRSFTLSFDMYPTCYATTYPYGFSVAWQNTAAGKTFAAAEAARGLCYRKIENPCPNSYAIGYDVAGSMVRFARSVDLGNGTTGGYFLAGNDDHDGLFSASASGVRPSATDCLRLTCAYDAELHQMVLTIRRLADSTSKSFTNNVNLAERCGGGAAYLRLAGQSGISTDSHGNRMEGEYLFGSIKLNYGTPAETRVAVGGRVSVPNNGTFNATLDEDPSVKAWTVNELARNNGDVTLNVSGAADASLGFSSFSGTGNIVKTGDASLGIGIGVSPLVGNLRVENGGLAFFPVGAALLAPTAANWQFSKPTAAEVEAGSTPADSGGLFVSGGFALGRTSNKEGTYSDNVNSTHRVYVGGRWKLSYRLKVSSNTNYGLLYFSLFFHNDPRGAAAKGTAYGATSGIENGAFVIWSPHAVQGGEVNNGVLVTGTPQKPTSGNTVSYSPVSLTAVGRTNIADPVTGNVGITNKIANVTLTYDPIAKKLNMKLDQEEGDHHFDHDFAIDIPAAVGGNYAYIGFGTSTPANWFNVVQTVTDLAFDDGTDRSIDGTLALTQPSTTIRLDGAAGQTNRLASTITVPASGRLVLASTNGVVATADSLVGDGALAIDGGAFAVSSAETITGVQELALDNGASLDIPPGVSVKVRKLFVDGTNMGAGFFTSDAPFVSGGGRIISGNGVTIIIR